MKPRSEFKPRSEAKQKSFLNCCRLNRSLWVNKPKIQSLGIYV